jgi:uncharacterized protein
MTISANKKAKNFQDVQNVFTQHMRDPENNIAPEGIEDRRLKIYRELVYNNIEDFIANSFPVLRKVVADEQWHKMMRDYVSNHQAHTPLFPKMPQEFIQYLEHERVEHLEDYPFLLELAHYEWIETSVSMDTREISFDGIEQEGDLLEGVPVLSPLAMPLAYQWPVHMISPDFLPELLPEQATYILIYRDRHDEVGFIELNSVSAKLIEECTNNTELSGKEILLSIAEQLQHPNPEAVINGGLEIMQDFKSKDIILGTKE